LRAEQLARSDSRRPGRRDPSVLETTARRKHRAARLAGKTTRTAGADSPDPLSSPPDTSAARVLAGSSLQTVPSRPAASSLSGQPAGGLLVVRSARRDPFLAPRGRKPTGTRTRAQQRPSRKARAERRPKARGRPGRLSWRAVSPAVLRRTPSPTGCGARREATTDDRATAIAGNDPRRATGPAGSMLLVLPRLGIVPCSPAPGRRSTQEPRVVGRKTAPSPRARTPTDGQRSWESGAEDRRAAESAHLGGLLAGTEKRAEKPIDGSLYGQETP